LRQAVVCGSGRGPCPFRGGLILSVISNWYAGADLRDLFGTLGVIGYIGAYLSLQLGLIKGDGYLFPALNLCAASAVLISLTRDFNPFSVTIEISWCVISVIGIARLYLVHRFVTLSNEEAEVARRIVPGLKKDRVRRLLRLGRFVDTPEGEILTVQGEPVREVAMVLSGLCHIERGTTHVASISVGALVGELTFATGAPATATVRTATPCRLFLIQREALLGFLRRNPDAMADMERSIAGDLRLKLADTTDRYSGMMAERDKPRA
jgi:hypothetical protein